MDATLPRAPVRTWDPENYNNSSNNRYGTLDAPMTSSFGTCPARLEMPPNALSLGADLLVTANVEFMAGYAAGRLIEYALSHLHPDAADRTDAVRLHAALALQIGLIAIAAYVVDRLVQHIRTIAISDERRRCELITAGVGLVGVTAGCGDSLGMRATALRKHWGTI